MSAPIPGTFVSIVIPVFNSETVLASLVDELMGCLQKTYRLEVILVNDASADRSEEVCVALHEKYPGHVKVLSLAQNAGEYKAVMAGLKHAAGEVAVIMDDDGQNPPSQVSALIEEAVGGGYDAVYGAYKRKRHPLWRNAASGFYNAAACLFLRKPPGLYLSSFKAVTRAILDEISRDNSPFPSIDGLILRKPRRLGQVFVDHEPRKSGKSGYSAAKLFLLGLRMFFFEVWNPAAHRMPPPLLIRQTWGIEKKGAE